MRLGIMQPYFFPYLGYFSLIKNTDQWIIFDDVQFIRHGWIERNRVLKPAEGWQYISVPLQKHERYAKICEVKIREEDWKGKIFRQLEHYKKAPYYNEVIKLLQKSFDIETDSITKLNAHILQTICQYLGIAFNYQIYTAMDLAIEPVNDAGEWALHISKAMGASQYINPPGGIEIFDQSKFQAANINILFLAVELSAYPQRRKTFEAGLSIIDVMMFNDPSAINQMLANFKFVS